MLSHRKEARVPLIWWHFTGQDIFKDKTSKMMLEQSKLYPEVIELIRKLKLKYGLKFVAVSN